MIPGTYKNNALFLNRSWFLIFRTHWAKCWWQNFDGQVLCCDGSAISNMLDLYDTMRCRHLFSRTNWKKLPKDRYFQWSEEASAEWSCERMTCWGKLLQSNDFIAQFIRSHRFWLRKKCGRPAKSLPSQHPKSDDCWWLCAQPMLIQTWQWDLGKSSQKWVKKIDCHVTMFDFQRIFIHM